jgi:hypothetical protein
LSVRPFGKLGVIADYIGFANQFPIGHIAMKHLTLSSGQSPTQKNWKKCLDLIKSGELDPTFLITHRAGLSSGPSLYKKFDAKEDGIVKVFLRPDIILQPSVPEPPSVHVPQASHLPQTSHEVPSSQLPKSEVQSSQLPKSYEVQASELPKSSNISSDLPKSSYEKSSYDVPSSQFSQTTSQQLPQSSKVSQSSQFTKTSEDSSKKQIFSE